MNTEGVIQMKREYFEKVNPSHPDKVADRIAGAIVDLAYANNDFPKIAVEVMIGSNKCFIIIQTTENISSNQVEDIVHRIAGEEYVVEAIIEPQDKHLANNQKGITRAGDNGIFKGLPITKTEQTLSRFARELYKKYPTDGKHILDTENKGRLVVCQSHFLEGDETYVTDLFFDVKVGTYVVNPLGAWTGGPSVDVGCTNRKLGSDMAQAVTGGGIHGKDLSKADVSLNIYAHLLAEEKQEEVLISCAIGDEEINGVPYSEIVEIAREYINNLGGFEKFAEWGLI